MELRHPNLIRVEEYFKDPIQPYFIMDLFPSYHLPKVRERARTKHADLVEELKAESLKFRDKAARDAQQLIELASQ